jgi:hypothetical protein
VRPARSWSFPSRLFRCVGTGTILASMICPPRAMRKMLVKTLKQLFDRLGQLLAESRAAQSPPA